MTSRTHWPRRGRILALLGSGVIVLAAGAAMVSADSGTYSVVVPDNTTSETVTTSGGAIVSYIGDSDVSYGSSGTGTFDSFVRVQADGAEAGYNTDGTLQFDTKSGKWTHAILVSDIPVISVGGQPYWELWNDINESNSTPRISLNKLEIYFAGSATVTGYPFGLTPVYAFDGTIQINDVNQGSGRGDLRYEVPTSGISIPASCSYKNPACATWFVLYSQWGDASGGTYASDGGFEEWKVKQYPYVTVAKTAATTYTRTFPWTIDKSVTPASWSLFTNESGTSHYTVDLTKGTGVDSAFAVNGGITITNPGTSSAVIASVGDVVSGAGAANVSCGVTFPYTLAKNATLSCTYTKSLPDATTRTNTATVTLDYGGMFTGTAPVSFGSPTTLVNDTVHVTDSVQGSLGAFSSSGSATYDKTWTCNADAGTHDNTATITETGQHDSASVTVSCYEINVTKDASTALTRTYNWTIDKSVTPATWKLFAGESGTSQYTVAVDKTGFTDSAWAVSGNIHVNNPNPIPATINSVSDVLATDGAATVDCGAATFPYTLAANSTLDCTYSKTLPGADNQLNTATAVRQNHSYTYLLVASNAGTTSKTGTANVSFGAPTTLIDESITIVDDYGTPANTADDKTFGPVSYTQAPKTFTYTRTFGPFGTDDCGKVTIDNTVTFTTNDTDTTGTDHWPVVITIPCPTGCTLTQGYWKTHSEFGPAPSDPDWNNLPGGLGPNTVFFTSGQTWYEVFWTTPKGGNAYYILAHQYEAAKLNILTPASAPQSVIDAITWSETFFANNGPTDNLSKTLRAEAISYAGILGSYNTGDIGPGHCSTDRISRSAAL